MDKAKQEPEEEKALPQGFILVPFHRVLSVINLTIIVGWGLTFDDSYSNYSMFIMLPLIILLTIITFVVRRNMRKFIRDNGEVEITFTFDKDFNRTRKHILNRDVSELIDDSIDRLLDGKQKP